jgi:ubiquinone/menaquinone biosynthesis C-methylase UbiE
MPAPAPDGAPDPSLALARYAAHAAHYDASARRTKALRARNVANLALAPGQRVLDVACGTGLSFPLLVAAVGAGGHVVGVELSPDMAAIARTRVADAGWRNVTILVSALEDAALAALGPFDAVHCNFTHDVLQSERALARIVGACRPGARVAVAGSKLLPWWLAPLNAYVRRNNAPYMTTQKNLDRPWRLLERHIDGVRVASALWGAGYLLTARVRRSPGAPDVKRH